MTARSLANQCRISPGTEVGFSWLGLGLVFIFHLYRATATVQLKLHAESVACTVPSVINENCIGERDCHLDFTLPPLANLMRYTTLRKNINDRFTCVGGFPVLFFCCCCCFLSRNLANAHLHFIAFYLVCV